MEACPDYSPDRRCCPDLSHPDGGNRGSAHHKPPWNEGASLNVQPQPRLGNNECSEEPIGFRTAAGMRATSRPASQKRDGRSPSPFQD